MSFFTVRGTKDYLPEEEIERQRILSIIRSTYEEFGFSPLDTPALETAETLLLKSESIRDEIYIFKDKGGREIGLRFDHTIPLARVVAQNPHLPLPFRRYAIGKVWRYDRPQSGRYREFIQADIDIVGSPSVLADAETVWAGTTALRRIGVPSFTVLFNNRKLIDGWGEAVGLKGEKLADFVRTVDKWFKIGEEGVRKELQAKNLENYLDMFKELFVDVSELPESNSLLSEAKNELLAFSEYLDDMGVPHRFDPRMVRGLDYYTGVVFETYVDDHLEWGSIGSGGRYDELIKLLSGREVPATGYSIGVDRLFNLLGRKSSPTVVRVYIASASGVSTKYILRVASLLREEGISTEYDVMERSLRKQLEYANRLNIPYAVIVGPEEEKRGTVVLKDLVKGEERRDVPLSNLPLLLKSLLSTHTTEGP